MDFKLTDEQRHFVAAIRDFCARECGTQDQRERLTDGYREHHNFEIYGKMAELGWLGVGIEEAYGGSGGGMLEACLEAVGLKRLVWGCDLTIETGWAKLRYLEHLLSAADLERVRWRNAAGIFPAGAFPSD